MRGEPILDSDRERARKRERAEPERTHSGSAEPNCRVSLHSNSAGSLRRLAPGPPAAALCTLLVNSIICRRAEVAQRCSKSSHWVQEKKTARTSRYRSKCSKWRFGASRWAARDRGAVVVQPHGPLEASSFLGGEVAACCVDLARPRAWPATFDSTPLTRSIPRLLISRHSDPGRMAFAPPIWHSRIPKRDRASPTPSAQAPVQQSPLKFRGGAVRDVDQG
jgi:hypothetical protein